MSGITGMEYLKVHTGEHFRSQPLVCTGTSAACRGVQDLENMQKVTFPSESKAPTPAVGFLQNCLTFPSNKTDR